MTLRGVGNVGPRGGPRGDILVVFEVEDDPRFERDGEDLYCEVLVTYPQLVLGADVEVPVVTGSVSLHVPRRHAERTGLPPARPRVAARERELAWAICTCACSSGRPTRLSDEEKTLIAQLGELQTVPATARRKGILVEDQRSARRVSWIALRITPGDESRRSDRGAVRGGLQGVQRTAHRS